MIFPDFFESINKPWGKDACLFSFEDSSWILLDKYYTKYKENFENKSSFIPKKIHQVWLGSELPQKSKELQKKIIDLNPEWSYKLWTDRDISYFGSDFENQLNKIENLGLKSDVFRYVILEAKGGIYLDCDFFCVKPFEPLINNVNFFAGVCDPGDNNLPLINNGFFGCSINHPLLKNISIEIKNNLDEGTQYQNQVEVFDFSGPSFFTRQIFKYMKYHSHDKVVIFPSSFFYPINNRKRNFITKKLLERSTYKETIAIHLWHASWVTSKRRFIDKIKDRLPLRHIRLIKSLKNNLKKILNF
jgi:mannosyltransferase OCH1-like enzyme